MVKAKANPDFHPLPDEVAMAQLSYTNWERAEAESMSEYISRRRTVDLAAIVRQVVSEELTEAEQQAIHLRYDEDLTQKEVASRLGVSASVVCKTLRRAEDKIYDYLKYVVQYQRNLRTLPVLPVVMREALVVSAARHNTTDFSARLQQLRIGENLSVNDVALACDILPIRLIEIENGQAVPDALELLRLSAFYGVTADAILRGEYGAYSY